MLDCDQSDGLCREKHKGSDLARVLQENLITTKRFSDIHNI